MHKLQDFTRFVLLFSFLAGAPALAGSSRVIELQLSAPTGAELASGAWEVLAQGTVRAKSHPLRPEVSFEGGLAVHVELPSAGRLSMLPLAVAAGGRSLAPGPGTLVSADGERLEVSESWQDVDELLVLSPGALKHDLLVSRAALETLGPGDLHASWKLEVPKGVRAQIEPGAGLVLRANDGSFLARVPPPLVADSGRGHAVRRAALAWDGTVLAVVVDAGWLADPAREFPLRIDPSITLLPAFTTRTGWVDELENMQTDAIDSGSLIDIEFGGDVRGFAEFDTSPIPDTATILDVVLEVFLSNHDNPDDPAVPLLMEIKAVNSRASALPDILFAAIPKLGMGTTYAFEYVPRTGSSFCPDAFVFRSYDLGPFADGELEAKLSLDWFTIGFVSQIVTDPLFDHVDYIGVSELVNNDDCPTRRLPGSRMRLLVEYADALPPDCDPGGPYTDGCPGGVVLLDGSGSSDPEGDPLTYAWTTDCPGVIEDADQEFATLLLDSPCSTVCFVTLTVDDGTEETSCSALVDLHYIDDPVLEDVPPDAVASCEDIPPVATPTASDDCDPAPMVRFLGEGREDGDCPDRFTLTRSWQAEDRCGRLSEIGTQVIEVRDDEPPVLEGVPPDALVSCDDIPPVAVPTAQDNCDPLPNAGFLGGVRDAGACLDSYTLRRRWQASDRCGNLSEIAEQVLTVVDDVAPVIDDPPADVEVSCDDVPPVPPLTATDDCDPAPVVELLSERRIDGACPDSYTLTRRWRAVDRCGNASAPILQVITVRDLEAPTLVGVPTDESVSCDAIPPPASPTAADDCDPAPVVEYLGETREDGPCPDTYTLRRNWQATDRCGNTSAVAEQVISVSDDTPPVIDAPPADVEVSCDDVPPLPTLSATDDCDPAPVVELLSERRIDGACPDSYTLTRRWRAVDRCGNASAPILQAITVRDLEAPTLVGVPTDESVSCDAIPPVASPAALDDCDPVPVVQYLGETREDGVCPDTYTLRRSWQATDRCGNASAVAEQVISVSDDTPPVIDDPPADVEVSCDEVPSVPTLTATDDCDPAPVVEFLGERRIDGACPDIYTLTRRWRAVDRCGNASTPILQVITVRDLEAPSLAGVPADAGVSCDAVPPPATPTAADDCDPAPFVEYLGEIREDGACPDTYTLRRQWQASDRCGNLSPVEEQVLTVSDDQAPTLSGVPADATVECDAVPPPPPVTAMDDCDPAPTTDFVETRVDGSCPGEYTLTRTWTALDRCGNASSQSQVLSVVDTTPPVVESAAGGDLACLWPPNHRYVCFDLDDFEVEASDACSEPVTLELVGCASNQPDDARTSDPDSEYNGDGHTVDDCLVLDDGQRVCVRAERAGGGPDAQDGRRYALTVVAVDACGNRSAPSSIGSIHVPHDQSPSTDCVSSTREGIKDKDLTR